MRKLLYSSLALGACLLSVACNDNTTSAGSSLVADEIEIIRDSTFTLTGLPEASSAVRSRTILQLLGRYNAKGYGEFSSDIVCQYMPAASIDTFGVKESYIDSVKLGLFMMKGAFAGDSTAPMGLEVHRLTRQLPTTLYSDFDPSGYYDPAVYASASYSALLQGAEVLGATSDKQLYKCILVDLPLQFGKDLYNRFITSPETFSTPQAFSQWFPGFYITNSFGSGRVTQFESNMIYMWYHSVHNIGTAAAPRDTTINHLGTYLAVTPEVYTNNNIKFQISPELKQRAESGEPILVAPIGYDVEFKFPASDILKKFNEQSGPLAVVNYLTFSIPVENITNNYGLNPPPYVLMVKKSKKDEFFAKPQANDDANSFVATYNATNKCYTFSSMLSYINSIIKKGTVTAEDEEFVICPVEINYYPANQNNNIYGLYYGSSASELTTISSITPYVTEPVMAKLNLSKARIEFSFSKQTLGR